MTLDAMDFTVDGRAWAARDELAKAGERGLSSPGLSSSVRYLSVMFGPAR